MTEGEGRDWVITRFGVPRGTVLERFGEILVSEARNQNLIATSTLETLWTRHFVDSAQLIPLAGDVVEGPWLDVGSGAGLPGLVVAILTDRPVILCEPRSRRVNFLTHAVDALGLAARVTIVSSKVEAYRPAAPAGIVSARAVAELSQLLQSTVQCTSLSTIWVLPKGRNAQSEVDAARRKWQGVFHVEPSITQPESGIVVARGVRPR